MCTTIIFLSVYYDIVERINKCAKDGSDVRFLLIANILISLMALGMALGIQGFLLYKAWKARKSTTYEVKIEAKKRVALDKNANQLDLESLETITMTMWIFNLRYRTWALGKILPEWMRWDLLKLTKFDSDLNFTITT